MVVGEAKRGMGEKWMMEVARREVDAVRARGAIRRLAAAIVGALRGVVNLLAAPQEFGLNDLVVAVRILLDSQGVSPKALVFVKVS